MNTNLQKAKDLLLESNYTCVLFDGENIHCSKERGVKPLLEFLDTNKNYSSYVAADKVIGAGAAHIYVLLGIKCIWADVISTAAKEILERNDIQIFFNQEVPHIINRTGDGICPIEQCVSGITDSKAALKNIKARIKELS